MNFTKAKMWAAAVGATLTALMTALATAQVALDDGALDLGDVGLITTAVVTLGSTVYAVWKMENKPVPTQNDTSQVTR